MMTRRQLRILAAAIAVGAILGPSLAMGQTPTNWLGGSANWTSAANWSNGVPNNGTPPGSTYAATIAAAGTYTVTLNSPNTVSTLTMNNASATLLVSNSTLTLANSATLSAGTVQLAAGTIAGGSITSAGGRIAPNFSTSTLNGVSLGANVLDMSAGRIALTNGTSFTGGPGTIALGGSSQVFIAEAVTIPSGTIFALGASSSVSADGGFTVNLDAVTTDTVTINVLGSNAGLGGGFQANIPNSILINKGRVQFDPATLSAILNIAANGAGSRFRNEGKVVAGSSGAANTINLSMASITNAGTLTAATGGIINLNGTFTRADLGTFTNTGGTINLAGTLNNTALNLDNSSGSLNIASGSIVGGTITAAGTARLKPGFNTGTLDGVSLGVNVLDMSAGRIALTNGTAFTGGPGTITLGNSSQVFIGQAATIPSGINFALGSSSSVSADGGFTATLDAATTDTVTINVLGSNAGLGGGFQNSAPNSILINKGRVQFDPATVGGILNIAANGAGSQFRNEGRVVASSSGAANTINLSMASITNAGTLTAATGGVINLNGTFTRADLGAFTNTGGIINLVGTLNNTSLDLDNSTGSLNMNPGTIIGGTVTAAGTARLKPGFSTGTLNGVSLGVNVLDMSAGRIALTNGTAFTGGPGTITLGNSSQVFIGQAATIPSGINFALGSSSSVSADGGFTATLDAATTDTVTINVLGSNAGLGGGFQNSAPNSILINKGRVQFDPATFGGILNIAANGAGSRFRNEGRVVAGSSGAANTINLSMASITNAGTLTAATGGVINLNGTFTRADLGTFTNTGGTVNLGGTLNNTSLELDNTTGSINMVSGTIVGGTVSATGTARLRPNFGSNILNGVSLGINVLDMTGGRVQLAGGTTFTGGPGTIALGSSSQVFLVQTIPTPSGTSFTLGSNSSVSADGLTGTLGAANPAVQTVRVNAGVAAFVSAGALASAPNSVLINQGLIDFAGPNSTLNITTAGSGSSVVNAGIIAANALATQVNVAGPPASFTNTGTLTAVNGGTISIAAGTTNFTNYNAGTQTLTGGTYQAFSSSVINFNGRTVTTIGPGTAILLDGASSVFTSATNTVTTNSGTFTIGNGKQNTVPGGAFTNAGSLTVGTIQGDTSLFTGNITSSGGSIVRGRGTIAGGITLASGSTLSPGTSPGILTVGGAVAMTSGSTFTIDLSGNAVGTGYSQLNLTGGGSINLNNATLQIGLNYAPGENDSFTIIGGGPVTGLFNGLPNGAAVSLGTFGGNEYKANLFYQSNTVIISNVVPEPSHILLLGGLGLGAYRWHRRRFTSPAVESASTP